MISISYLNGDGKCPTGPAGLKVPANFSAYRLLSTLIQLYTSGGYFRIWTKAKRKKTNSN